MKKILSAAMIAFISLTGCSQPASKKNLVHVGGSCEGCEAIFEYGSKVLAAVDTLPDFNETGPKIKVTGTVYRNDGKTPARDVIIYVYHTNQQGIYAAKGGETGWAKNIICYFISFQSFLMVRYFFCVFA